MHRQYRSLCLLLLLAAISMPAAMMAAQPQDQEHKQSENKRYYDKGHKDYHTWDDNEDRAYQRYQAEHHEKRAFVRLSSHQQTIYWSWRHNNPDNR